MKKKVDPRFPTGWDEQRVREVIEHYEAQSEEEAVAEEEAPGASTGAGLVSSVNKGGVLVNWDSEVRQAIQSKQVLDFTYHGLHRVAEPHVYGIKDGKYQLLAYQIRGESSSGGLPNWRRVELDAVSGLKILNEHFPGRRPTPTGQHQAFDTILLIVDD